ncbi:glucan endo-1,3-beta-glucosidase-like [Euphorbia lathyris]|uniref:glucan endo-1,3-beta-glucosidase-like n=1 Tax=Euphorbia lathyris TaxID=212925 RepID=UPI003313B2AE
MAAFLLPLVLLISLLGITGVQSIGVCYGKNGNDLPSETEVVGLYRSNNIGRMRIYHPDKPTLEALRGSNIELILGAANDNLQSLANDASAAATWVRDNVVAYASNVKIKYIAVGNEVHPGDANARYVLPAMQNIQTAITSANLQGQIKVSTAIDTTLLGNSFPPSAGVFSGAASSYIGPIINFLASNGAPLLTNVYTYFSYVDNPQSISLEYALFTSPGVVVTDGQFQYQNLFDALMDALYAALEKSGGANLQIVVSESGWPSEGSNVATAANAGTYHKNLINHVKQGTPRRSGQAIETYLFAMFDENLKAAGIEQHFGLFRPNKENKYQITFG